MNRLPNQYPIVNGPIVWTICLVSASLFVPWILAQSLSNDPDTVTPTTCKDGKSCTDALNPIYTPQPSPQEVENSPVKPTNIPWSGATTEKDWHHNLVSQSLSFQYSQFTTPDNTPSPKSIPQPPTLAVKTTISNPKNPTQANQLAQTNQPQSNPSQQLSQSPKQPATSNQELSQTPQEQSNSSQQLSQTSKQQGNPNQELFQTPKQPSNPSQELSQTPKQQSQPRTQAASKPQNSQPSQTKSHQAVAKHPVIEMRVAIGMNLKSIVIATSTPGEIVDAKGKLLDKLSENQAIDVLPGGPNIRVGKWTTPAGVWIKPTKGGLVFVNNRWYRGDLLLVSKGNSLLAVNYVDLETYLASVVGAEVYPNWPMDALKAQAIAARSYAIVHYIRPANTLYDLGNTQRWQVYKGIESEWNTTSQAVEETNGVFLSYKGGVVESLYAASDSLVANVFGGKGMSQNGAYKLAQQGYDYKQILNNYYPGTSLAWLDTTSSDSN